jgi:hypothetical protein
MSLKRLRRFGVALLTIVSLLSVGYDSQHPLKNRIMEVDVGLKAIEKRLGSSSEPFAHFSFNDQDIQATLQKLKKLSSDLTTASFQKTSLSILTEVSNRYLTDLAAFYALYARAAHASGAQTFKMSFDVLSPFNLILNEDAAKELIKQKPFNAKHLDGGRVEFFLTSQEKQMAEFYALATPRDELTYSKLIQFAALHETISNFWALQRLNYSPIPLRPVIGCAPELLSFRSGPNGDLKKALAYQELTSLDRYNLTSKQLSSAFDSVKDLSLLNSGEYYGLLSKTLSSTPEFKAYISGVPPKEVSHWLNIAAQQVAKTEQDNWSGDSSDSLKVLGASTYLGDTLSSTEIARRMAQSVFDRRADAILAQIARIATDNVKIANSAQVRAQAQNMLNAERGQWMQEAERRLSTVTKRLDESSTSNQEVTERLNAKVDETIQLAYKLMPAMHDHDLIDQKIGHVVETEAEYKRAPLLAMTEYLRPHFQLLITDPDTLKSHLTLQIQKNPSLWRKLQSDRTAMLAMNAFFLGLSKNFALSPQQPPVTSNDMAQAAKRLLSAAQASAKALLQKLAPIPSSQALLRSAFATINLQGAKIPTDLSPKTQQQLDLANLLIAQAYEQNPLLAVNIKIKRGWFDETEGTVLERLYREAWPAGSPFRSQAGKDGVFNSNARTIVVQGIQTATQNIRGKIEDFCQANLRDPGHDPRFRNLFLSAGHLRKILASGDDPKQAQLVRKFDESLKKKTQTTQEAILDRYVNPVLTVVFFATLAVMLIALAPLSAPVLLTISTLSLVLNFFVMAPLSAASLYLRLSTTFFEQPAQLRYQEALASSQVSAQDPFEQWEQLKSKGLLASLTNKATLNENKAALVNSQVLTIAQLPMDLWYGRDIVRGVRSNVGITGAKKLRELFGDEIPAFAERVAAVKAPSFRENVKAKGLAATVKQKSVETLDQAKVIVGAKPLIGPYTSKEALVALKMALARQMPDESRELLPELRLYSDFLRARLKVTRAAQTLVYEDAEVIPPSVREEMPDFLSSFRGAHQYENVGKTSDGADILMDSGEVRDDVRSFWTDAPELNGRLSFKEMLENPQLRKWLLIPKSAIKALRSGRLGEWIRGYSGVVKTINRLRGKFIADKLTAFETLEAKIQASITRGENVKTLVSNLTEHELSLLEEAARGPQWLAYGYWSSKFASLRLPNSTLKDLLSVFEDYQTMLRSLRPTDYFPRGMAEEAVDPDQQDIRDYYRLTRGRDDFDTPQTGKVLLLEGQIEDSLYRKAH